MYLDLCFKLENEVRNNKLEKSIKHKIVSWWYIQNAKLLHNFQS